MPDQYIDYPIVFDEVAIYNRAIAKVQETFPSWVPPRGSLIDLTLRTCAMMAAIGAEVASGVPVDIFRAFGPLARQPAIDSTPATAVAVFTVQDGNGYTIPGGTPVALTSAAQSSPQGFITVGDNVVPVGSTTLDVGLVAAIPGAGQDNLDTVTRIDSLPFVTSIALVGTSTGGTNSELTSDYIQRLALEFETWSTTPLRGRDFAIVATKVAGVYRCGYLENYDPVAATFGNDKYVTLCPLDISGAACNVTVRNALATYIASLRELNFVCPVVTPTINTIDVSYRAHVDDPSVEASTLALTNSAVQTLLNPALWGVPANLATGERPLWNNTTVLRLNKVIQAIENIVPVTYVDNVQIGIHGGSLGTADLTLTGPFPLPAVGTITSSVVSP